MKEKVITCQKAAALIKDGDVVAIQGSGGGVGEPTMLIRAVRERYLAESAPKNITLLHATGLGDKREIGADLLAIPGLVRRDIAGHLGMAPAMGRMIVENQVESYNFPQGVLSQMYTAIAGRKPGVFSKAGLHTYIDPRLEGGKMNVITREDLLKVVQLEGEEWLFWPRFTVNIAFIRGTTADLRGNITCEQEPAILEGIAIAQAARACGGIVIAQVKYLAREGSLDPRLVKIPGMCVDYVVVDPSQWQTCLTEYEPAFCGQVSMPLEALSPLALDERKVVARRAVQELFPGAVVNLGYGMPDGVATVAAEQGIVDLTLTVEQGIVGGRPAPGVIFGVAYNPEAIIGEDDQFNFYDGGGLDIAFLGMSQVDEKGNVNASKVGSSLAGCGGFINISQNAREVVFCGTFTAKGCQYAVGDGRLAVLHEGSIRKFVSSVDQITFSGDYARSLGQKALYVTERAVFELTSEGLVLREIAPGVDLERDVLQLMGFRPAIAPDLMLMNENIFY
jgi:propionate CoA-transferase